MTEGAGPVQGVQGGDDGGICGETHNDSAWESGRGATELEDIGHRGIAVGISNGLPGQGSPTELPGGGMPRPSGNEDGDGGALPALACPQHRGHYVGGKLPPPTVHLMRHDGPPARPERQAPCHSPVQQRSGAEEAAGHRGEDDGEFRAGLQGIQGAAGERHDI